MEMIQTQFCSLLYRKQGGGESSKEIADIVKNGGKRWSRKITSVSYRA
jgi:hypothetical protein